MHEPYSSSTTIINIHNTFEYFDNDNFQKHSHCNIILITFILYVLKKHQVTSALFELFRNDEILILEASTKLSIVYCLSMLIIDPICCF